MLYASRRLGLAFEISTKAHKPKHFKYHLIAMAFWFGITSMIRPASLERIPASFALASMKQGLSAATSQQQIPRSPQTYSHSTPNFGGADALCNSTPRDRYIFLKCRDDRGNALVSRIMERERDSSTYCITGTEYEWMAASAYRAGHRWKRSWY